MSKKNEIKIANSENYIVMLEAKRREYQEKIDTGQFIDEAQKAKLERKIEGATAHLEMMYAGLAVRKQRAEAERPTSEPPPLDNLERKRIMLELQEIAVRKIQDLMAQMYPKIKYTIKCSLSTESIYLRLENEHGIIHSVRFSNHKATNGATMHYTQECLSRKSFKQIVDKALKGMERRTVRILLKRLDNENGK